MIEEFNVDSKGECDQLNLAHETKTRPDSHVPTVTIPLSRTICEIQRFIGWKLRSYHTLSVFEAPAEGDSVPISYQD